MDRLKIHTWVMLVSVMPLAGCSSTTAKKPHQPPEAYALSKQYYEVAYSMNWKQLPFKMPKTRKSRGGSLRSGKPFHSPMGAWNRPDRRAVQRHHQKGGDRDNGLAPLVYTGSELQKKLMAFHREWEGTPYKLGGTGRRGIDCSAYVQKAYDVVLRRSLPRTTKLQVKKGRWIDKRNLKIGDLIFFKTTPTVRHVGIYVGVNKNNERIFMNASTTYGVSIAVLKDKSYWGARYWQSRRMM